MRGNLAVLAAAALALGILGTVSAAPEQGQGQKVDNAAAAPQPRSWGAAVLEALRTPPNHPRRVMLVFPLVEKGSAEGKVGWDRGLIAMQAMWRSSFAPDRLLDTWDFGVQYLFTDQQLIGPGRTVTAKKIEDLCADFNAQNYTTGTLAVSDDAYTAELTFHGEHGERQKTYTGPRADLYRLPCQIAADVVDYIGVPLAEGQREQLQQPLVNSNAVMDEVADRYSAFWALDNDYWRYWWDLLAKSRTPWTEELYLTTVKKRGADWALKNWKNGAPTTSGLVFDTIEAGLTYRVAEDEGSWESCRDAVDRLLPILQRDPYNPYAVQWLAFTLITMGEDKLVDAALDRFDLIFPNSPRAAMFRSYVLIDYAWHARGTGLAYAVSPEGWRLFSERLNRARTDLENAIAQEPRLWSVDDELITVALGLNLPRDYVMECFNRATAACPTYRQIYSAVQYYLEPKWHGSAQQMLDWGRGAADTGLYEAGIPLLLYEAHVSILAYPLEQKEDPGRMQAHFTTPEVLAEVEPVLAKSVEVNPYDRAALSQYLQLAYWKGDRELALRLLARCRRDDKSPEDDDVYYPVLTGDRYREIYEWAHATASVLHDTAATGSKEDLQRVLKTETNLEQKNDAGQTALHVAAIKGRWEAVQLLLAAGAAVDARDAKGWTPLKHAAAASNQPVAELFIDAGADLNAKDKDGRTPLHEAANTYSPAVISLLLRHGADPNAADNTGLTPLHAAAALAQAEPAKVLLAFGARADVAGGEKRQTPLHRAAATGTWETVQALLDYHADIEALDADGATPLTTAASNGRTEMVGLLMTKGAKADVPTSDGWTPLHYAAQTGQRAMAQMLLDAGAKADSPDKGGTRPLAKCAGARSGGAETAVLLIEHGADVKASDSGQMTALHAAALLGNLKLADLLLQHGAELEARQGIQRTPLWLAARGGQAEMVRLLAAKGASVNAADQWDLTPLHMAAGAGNAEVVDLLLGLGADPKALNNDKLTPADLAEKGGHPALAQVLRDAALKAHPGAGG